MSATQDLIAAALRLTALAERNTDDRDEWQHSISEVREMCARAMVQPVCQQQDGPPEDWQDAPPGNVGHPKENTRPVFIEDQVRTYGDAREAAGYAAGVAAGGKDAERYRHAKLHGWPEYRCEIHPNPNGVPQWGYCGYWFDSPDAAIDAALRGEVKP